METITSVEEYNNYLIKNKMILTIVEYVQDINEIIYNIDIDFIDELLELVIKDECCIHHNMLVKYGIVSLKSGTTDIKRLIEQYEFNDQDCLLRNVAEQLKSGTKYKNEYYFHPDAFKLCLMRSLKTKKYAKYYILLEKCIKYYNDYQIILNKKYNIELTNKITMKDKKINNLEKKIDNMLKSNKKMMQKMDKQSKKMDKQSEKMDRQSEQLTELQITVNKISSKLDNCAHMPTDNELSDRFVVMKSTDDYYVIRAQERNIYNAIRRQEDKGFTKITDLIESESIPNSIYLWNTIKDELVREKKIKTFRNSFTLNMSENDFVTIVKSIFDQRKHYN